MDRVCHEGGVRTRALLERAKQTVAHGYAFVGLTAEMKINFLILKKLLPAYFDNPDIPTDICNKCKKGEGVQDEKGPLRGAAERGDGQNGNEEEAPHDPAVSPPPPPAAPPRRVSEENERRIAQLNVLDVELYAFVEQLFWLKAAACGVVDTEAARR